MFLKPKTLPKVGCIFFRRIHKIKKHIYHNWNLKNLFVQTKVRFKGTFKTTQNTCSIKHKEFKLNY